MEKKVRDTAERVVVLVVGNQKKNTRNGSDVKYWSENKSPSKNP